MLGGHEYPGPLVLTTDTNNVADSERDEAAKRPRHCCDGKEDGEMKCMFCR